MPVPELFAPPQDDINALPSDIKALYDEILLNDGQETATEYFNNYQGNLGGDSVFKDEPPILPEQMKQPVEYDSQGRLRTVMQKQRAIPGIDTKEPQPSLENLQLNRELELMGRKFQVSLDEKQEEAYNAALDRFKREGLPDESQLQRLFELEYDDIYTGRTGKAVPTLGQGADYSDYLAGQFEYIQQEMPKETAQTRALDEVFGQSKITDKVTPRKPRSVQPYEVKATPVKPGMLQKNPELAREMSTLEVAKDALSPQTITTGRQARRERALETMRRENAIDVILRLEKERFDGDRTAAQDSYFENFEIIQRNQLARGRGFQTIPETGEIFRGSQPFLTQEQGDLEKAQKEIDEAARKMTRNHIEEVYAPVGPTENSEDLLKKFPFMPGTEPSTFDEILNIGGGLLEEFGTTKYDPSSRRRMYEMGITDDPDAITETFPMAIARDLNLPLRIAMNPVISGLENVGLIERRTPEEERVGFREEDTILPAERIELTEEVPFYNPFAMTNAFLKEVLVETATMRSLGNDLATVKSFGLPGVGAIYEPSATARDYITGAGTFAELFIPMFPVAKASKLSSIPGKGVKGAARMLGASEDTINTIKKYGKIAEVPIDIVGSQNVLFPVAKYGLAKVPGVLERTAILGRTGRYLDEVGALARQTDDVPASQQLEATIDAVNSEKPDFVDVVIDTYAGEARIAETMADGQAKNLAVLKLRSVTDDAELASVSAELFGQDSKGARFFDDLTQEGAYNALNEMATKLPADNPLGDAARKLLATDTNDFGILRGVAYDDIYNALRKGDIGDSVLLTDKMIISNSFMKENKKKIVEHFIGEDGKHKYLVEAGEDGMVTPKTEPFREIQIADRFGIHKDDNVFIDIVNRAANGEKIPVGEFAYAMSRITEDVAYKLAVGVDGTPQKARGASGLARVTDKDVLEAAAEPLERRGAFFKGPRTFLSNVFETVTPAGLQNSLKSATKKAQDFIAPARIPDKQAFTQNFARSAKFEQDVYEGIERLQRTGLGAYSNVAKNVRDAKLPGFEFLNIPGQKPIQTGRGDTLRVYFSVLHLQDEGFSLGDISRMSKEQMTELLEEGFNLETIAVRMTDDLIDQSGLGKLRTQENLVEMAEDLTMNQGLQGVQFFEKFYENVFDMYPELLAYKPKNMTDLLTTIVMNKEIDSIVGRSVKENLMGDEFTRSIGTITPMTGKEDPQMLSTFIEEVLSDTRTYDPTQPGGLTRIMSTTDGYSDISSLYDMVEVEAAVRGMRDYLYASGTRIGKADPESLTEMMGMAVRALDDKQPGIVTLVTPKERQLLNTFGRSAQSGDTSIIKRNLANLQKMPSGVGEFALDGMNAYINGLRRTLVSGQLGGKYVPNLVYQTENLMTAPLIALVTNPRYVGTVIGQVPQTLVGATPYRKLRFQAQNNPGGVLPGTRYTYAEVFDQFNRKNLGVSNAGVNLGDSFYRDLEQASRGWQQFTEGIPGYAGWKKAFEMETLGQQGKGLASSGKRMVQDILQGGTEVGKPLTPNTTAGMRWADEVDRSFREAIFIKALQNGESFETAAKLARETMLDYGKMPPQLRQGFMKMALYMSFQYLTMAEMVRALTSPGGATRVAAMANFHRNVARQAGSWYYAGDQAMQAVYQDAMFDEKTYKQSGAIQYMRSPYMGALVNMANAGGYLTGIITGRGEDLAERGKQGLSEAMYLPIIQFMTDLDTEYKRGVPPKALQQMLTDQYGSPTVLGMKAPADKILDYGMSFMIGETPRHGASIHYLFDRYDIEVRPVEKRIVGSPTVNEMQYRFRSKEGYNNFLIDQMKLALAGSQRSFNDYFNALVAAGEIKIPDEYGYDFGYSDDGKPGFFSYTFGRARPLRVPKEIEVEYRMLKEQERRLIEHIKKYEK